MRYHYKSPVGIFWIRPQPNSPRRYWLGIDDTPFKRYKNGVLREDASFYIWQIKDGQFKEPDPNAP